jgi:hypothetical protein
MKAKVAKQRLLFMQEEDEQHHGKTHLQTWEMVCCNICMLQKDLSNLNKAKVSERAEIKEDIEGLKEQKKELARDLRNQEEVENKNLGISKNGSTSLPGNILRMYQTC